MNKKKTLAIICSDLNGPAGLTFETREISKPRAGEVQIGVKAVALNFPDLLMTYGKYQFKPSLPFIPGMEGAGVVTDIGPEVSRFCVGDKVIFKGKTGACSEFTNVRVESLHDLPDSFSFEEGAAFAVTYSTAYVALVKRGGLKAGETLLVHGAGGGVGQASVSVGKALGATVIASASTEEKLKVARLSGADHVINYKEHSFSKKVNEMTNGRGVDVVLDPVGGEVLNESVSCLAWEGRLLCVGFASGDFGNIPLLSLQECAGRLIGVRAGEYTKKNPFEGAKAYDELIRLVSENELRPWIGRRVPLKETAVALQAMENRELVGKQVITINGGQ